MGITARFDDLEKKRDEFLRTVFSWTPGQLRFRPTPSAWSALQVVDHVLKTERGIFSEMQTNLPGARKSPFKHRIRGSLLNALMSSPVRLKVPAAAMIVLPSTTPDLHEMAAAWNTIRRDQKEWLVSLNQIDSSKGVFRHPVSGWMTPSQCLGFLCAHLHHHGYQLQRIRRDRSWSTTQAMA
jgi:hypothetical protein